MISRDLLVKVGHTNSILTNPLSLYFWDRKINLNIHIIEYDFKFGGDLNGNFIGKNKIVKAKTYLRSPRGQIFTYPDVETKVQNDAVNVIINALMTNETTEIGEWSMQIQVFDSDNSSMHLHPFKFYLYDLITGDVERKLNIDIWGMEEEGYQYDPIKTNDKIITSDYLNQIENKLEYVYGEEFYNDIEINNYNTSNKTTVGAINELNSLYSKMYSDYKGIVDGTIDIEEYKKEHGLAVDEKKVYITNIEINNKAYNKIAVGDYYLYKVNVTPESMEDSKYSIVRWKSEDTSIAKVNSTGKVVGVSKGEAVITAYNKYDESINDSFLVKIGNYIPLNSIVVEKTSFEVPLNDKITVPVSFIPSNTTETGLYWESSDTTIARVDQLGNISGVGIGTTTITIKSLDRPDKSISIKVEVKDPTIITKSVTIEDLNYSVYVDDEIEMKCITNPVGLPVVWSCTGNAEITSDGLLKVTGEGTITITCKLQSDDTIRDTITINATINYGVPPTGIIINNYPANGQVYVGETFKCDYTLEPEGADDRLSWHSSDTEVAIVTNDGSITIVGEGNVTITVFSVSSPDTKISFDLQCLITVTKVTITNPVSSLIYGENHKCNINVEPKLPSNVAPFWTSSNTKVATVDDGLITTTGVGTTTISVTVNGVSTSFDLECKSKIPSIMNINNPTSMIEVFKDYMFTLSFDDMYTDSRVTWTSDNENVVKINNDGSLETYMPGTVNITVQSVPNPSLTRNFKLTVIKCKPDKIEIRNPVSSIKLTGPTAQIGKQFYLDFYYYKNGSYYKSDYCEKGVKWEITGKKCNEIASLTQSGYLLVKGVGLINVVVTSTANTSLSTKLEVDCIPNEEIKIIVNNPYITAETNSSFSIDYTVFPSGYNIPVDITFDDPNDVVIDYADSMGIAGIYGIPVVGLFFASISTLNSKKVSAVVMIDVIKSITAISLVANIDDTNNIASDYVDLTINYYPPDATIGAHKLKWESSDESVATILTGSATSTTRRILKKGGGSVNITCTVSNSIRSVSTKINLSFVSEIQYKVKLGGDRSFRLNGNMVEGTIISNDTKFSTCLYTTKDAITDISFRNNSDLVEVIELDTGNVYDASDMFYCCYSLTSVPKLDISNTEIAGGLYINGEYAGTSDWFTIPLDVDFEVQGMFYNCTSLTSIPDLDTSNIRNMSYMFYGCRSLTSIPDLDTGRVSVMSGTFSGCSSLERVPNLSSTKNVYSFGAPLICLSLSSGGYHYYHYGDGAFGGCSSLTSIPDLDTSNVKNMSGMFTSCSSLTSIPDLDTSNVTDMSNIFASCSSLTSIPYLNTGHVTDMSGMFYHCYSLTSIPYLNTTGVTNMESMFASCSSLTSIPDLDTFNVRKMFQMFYGCSSLTSLDISHWDTSNVTDMGYMFYNCSNLTSLDLSRWDTSNVTEMKYIFYNCSNLTSLDISDWDTSNVTDMRYMFYNCSNLTSLDISDWDTSNVTDMRYMFYNCGSLAMKIDPNKFWSNPSVLYYYSCFDLCYEMIKINNIPSRWR